MLIQVIKDSVVHGGTIYKVGDSFECDEAIAESLMERGYCEEKRQVGHLDEEDLNSMKYSDLQRLAKDMGLDASGKKAEIIARIAAEEVQYDEEVQDEEGPATEMEF